MGDDFLAQLVPGLIVEALCGGLGAIVAVVCAVLLFQRWR